MTARRKAKSPALPDYDANFPSDDYFEIQARYFSDLRTRGKLRADPSGWLDTISNGEDLLPRQLPRPRSLCGYQSDEGHSLKRLKQPILECISRWDRHEYRSDEVTLCHSTTVGSAIVLAALRGRSMDTVIFETPYYFASYWQAQRMGFRTVRVPTFHKDGFADDRLKTLVSSIRDKCVLWVTQPRMSLGMNQTSEDIDALVACMPSGSVLVIDEATEQSWPATLTLPLDRKARRVSTIRIRSLTKGIGLNGLRCAYVAHSSTLRPVMTDWMECFQGGLDVVTLEYMSKRICNTALYPRLLSAARAQVETLHRMAQSLVHPVMSLGATSNGYISHLMIPNSLGRSRYLRFRERLLRHCRKHYCPVILGASMGFALDPDREYVRMNYYNRPHNIVEGIRVLSQFCVTQEGR